MSKIKQQTHIAAAQKQIQKAKLRSQKYVPGSISLQILGTGAQGTPSTVYLFTDQTRYLFNCGEGTQRLAHEHKTKLTRLEHIFVTQRSWKSIGGLPGLSLTVQDAGVSNITLHGPEKLSDVFRAMRRFVVLKHLKVEARECNESTFYEDMILKVNYLPLCDSNDDYSVMCFLCKCKPKPGSLSLEKCLKMGVPKGPLLGKLKNGETVTTESGITVRAEDVREPDDPGPTFLVVDIPSIDFLSSLQHNKIFEEYLKESYLESERGDLVLHFTPSSVMSTLNYKLFIDSFPNSTQHIVINEQNKFSGYVAAHRLQWQLNQLNKNIFPILKEPLPQQTEFETSTKRMKLNEDITETKEQPPIVKLQPVSPMTCLQLRPKKCVDHSLEAWPNHNEFVKEVIDIEGMTDTLEGLKSYYAECPTIDRPNEYPKVVFFGTGSCIPNKTRNVSSILVHTNKDTCILLDVGEGTMGQIHRFYGDEADNVIKKLKAIYISHLHADHHIGLFGIIQLRQQICDETHIPILLLAPSEIEPWIKFYKNEFEKISTEFEFIDNQTLIETELSEDKLAMLGLSTLRTCGVIHCPSAFGVTMTIVQSNQPFKLTYSGDTKPCDELVKLGLNSTLLIHEATMEDELIEDALLKMHSTVSQAIEQSKKMNAKYTILTHFSQRYAKIPRIEQHLVDNIGIAFDNMEVILSDLSYLNILYPAMKKMFPDHWDEMAQKSIKRAQRKIMES